MFFEAWDVMISMLLSSERSENELRENALANRDQGAQLDNNSETLLLYLMLACAKMAKGTLTVGNDKKRKKRSKAKMVQFISYSFQVKTMVSIVDNFSNPCVQDF